MFCILCCVVAAPSVIFLIRENKVSLMHAESENKWGRGGGGGGGELVWVDAKGLREDTSSLAHADYQWLSAGSILVRGLKFWALVCNVFWS